MGSTHGIECAVDKIFTVCAEQYLLLRTAIGIARNPPPQIHEACYILAGEIGKKLEKLEQNTLVSIFEIRSNYSRESLQGCP